MVEQVLVVLRVAFVVLLYLVVWRIVRLSVRDVRGGTQDSMILAPAMAGGVAAPARPARAPQGPGQLVVTSSPAFPAGTVVLCDDTVVFGRGPEADAVLEGDEFGVRTPRAACSGAVTTSTSRTSGRPTARS